MNTPSSSGSTAIIDSKVPLIFVVTWAIYVLLVLGWLGYREALAGFFCVTR